MKFRIRLNASSAVCECGNHLFLKTDSGNFVCSVCQRWYMEVNEAPENRLTPSELSNAFTNALLSKYADLIYNKGAGGCLESKLNERVEEFLKAVSKGRTLYKTNEI